MVYRDGTSRLVRCFQAEESALKEAYEAVLEQKQSGSEATIWYEDQSEQSASVSDYSKAVCRRKSNGHCEGMTAT